MSGTRIHSRREGDRSEYFAQVLLSGLGLSVPIPRQEDIGFDFLCTLSDQESGVLSFGSPYLVSVKSLSYPNIELQPTKAAIEQNSQRHIEWLFRQELPSFLGVVDKDNFRMSLFSLIPIWFIYYEGGPTCGAMIIRPRFDEKDLDDVGRPKKMEEVPGWTGMHLFDVDLGHPIAVVDLDTLKDVKATASVKQRLRQVIHYAQMNHIHFHLGVPYFYWFARTSPKGEVLQPAFYQQPIPPDEDARKRIMAELVPSLISFALHFKQAGKHEDLNAIKTLLKDFPASFFHDVIQKAIPEIITSEKKA